MSGRLQDNHAPGATHLCNRKARTSAASTADGLANAVSDLTSTGYQPDFDLDLSLGALGEHLVGTFWEDLQREGRVEVKVDRGAWKTGNHYVEVHQWDGQRWKPSGISITKAEWWAVVSPSGMGFVVVRTELLRELVRKAPQRTQPIANERTNATAGRLVKMVDLMTEMMREVQS